MENITGGYSTMTNDEKILELKAKIDEKRKKIGTLERHKFVPETNCSIEIDGARYNLHAASKSNLVFLLCKLQSLKDAAKVYHCESQLVISGYNIQTWIDDVLSRLKSLDYSSNMKRLKSLEDRLDSMLSDDMKTELELQEIEDLI